MKRAANTSNSNRWALPVAAGVGMAMVIAACAPAAVTPAPGATGEATHSPTTETSPPAEAPTKITVLLTTQLDPTEIPSLKALERLEQELGIEVDVQRITGGDAAQKALIAGQADFVYDSAGGGLVAVARGQTIKAVAYDGLAPYFTLVTRSDIQDLKGLEGKTIGVTATTDSSYYTTFMLLQENEVDESQVTWILVRGAAARAAALRGGKIDAGQLLVGQALDIMNDPAHEGEFHRLADVAAYFPDFMFLLYWTRDEFIRDHPDIVHALAKAMVEEHCLIMDKDEYMAQAMPLLEAVQDRETVSASYDILREMNIWDPNGDRFTSDAADFTTQTLVDFGLLSEFVPADRWIYTAGVEAASDELGRCAN